MPAHRISNGHSGFVEISDTAEYDYSTDGKIVEAIQFVTDTVFTKLRGNGTIKGANTAGVVTSGHTYTANSNPIFGQFDLVKLASGHVRVFFA